MNKNRFYFFLSLFFSTLFLCCSSSDDENPPKPPIVPPIDTIIYEDVFVDLLWNQGITKKNYHHLSDHDVVGVKPALCEITDLSELIEGKPKNINEKLACEDGSYIMAADGSTPSATLISLNYENREFIRDYDPSKNSTGFGFNIRREKENEPIEFEIKNMAKSYTNTDSIHQLHEVGFLFTHWGLNPGIWAFKDLYSIGEFKNFQLKFIAKVDDFQLGAKDHAMFVTCDFRYVFWDKERKNSVRGDLLGVLVFERNIGNNVNPIYWQSSENIGGFASERILLRGMFFDVKQLSNEYAEVTINYKNLIDKLPAPPAGLTYDDAFISGLDIYSSVRGSDLNFSIKDIRFYGVKTVEKK